MTACGAVASTAPIMSPSWVTGTATTRRSVPGSGAHPAGERIGELRPTTGRATATQQLAVVVVDRQFDRTLPAHVADLLVVVDVTGHDDRDRVGDALQLAPLGLQGVLEDRHPQRHAEQADGQHRDPDGETDDPRAHAVSGYEGRVLRASGANSSRYP